MLPACLHSPPHTSIKINYFPSGSCRLAVELSANPMLPINNAYNCYYDGDYVCRKLKYSLGLYVWDQANYHSDLFALSRACWWTWNVRKCEINQRKYGIIVSIESAVGYHSQEFVRIVAHIETMQTFVTINRIPSTTLFRVFGRHSHAIAGDGITFN